MKLTVVILSYNVEKLIQKNIRAIYDTYGGKNLQIIVVDNASTDGSVSMIKREFPRVDLIRSKFNKGFSSGNNMARKHVKGKYVLFLNADTEVGKNTIDRCLEILSGRKDLGAVTCKVLLPDGRLDYSCHRGIPTPWNSFCYFTGLSKLFPRTKFFSGYDASYLNTNESHHIDCLSGTFLLTTKEILDEIGWWDEDYWFNGEDIEFCYQLKKGGYKIWYEASVEMLHHKGASSGLWNTSKVKVSDEIKMKTAISSSKAMRLFVEKHWKELGPRPLMQFVRLGIFVLEKYRLFLISIGKTYK